MDTSVNYATDQPYEVLFNFSLNYDPENAPRRSSTFDKLSPRPPGNRQTQQLPLPRNRWNEEPQFEMQAKLAYDNDNPLPRNRHERRVEQIEN